MRKRLTSFEDIALDLARHSEDRGQKIVTPASPAPVAEAEPDGFSQAWRELLSETIEREVLPRLLTAKTWNVEDLDAPIFGEIDDLTVAAFVQLLIDDDVEQLRAVADRVILHTGGREALLAELLKPAAQLLGLMWERDTCDFMTVTLGVYRLNQIMRETAAGNEFLRAPGFEHRILLLPAPGEQHSFGITMVADAFREGGWCVRSAPSVTRPQLLRLVKDEWFDMVGLSVSTDRWLKGLPSCIRAIRAASCNPDVYIMLGGYAIARNAERTRFLGADSAAADASEALKQANIFMETTVTRRFCQSKTKLSDTSRAL